MNNELMCRCPECGHNNYLLGFDLTPQGNWICPGCYLVFPSIPPLLEPIPEPNVITSGRAKRG